MSRLLLLELAVGATILGLIVFFATGASDCRERGGALVVVLPIGIECVARL